MIRDNNHTRLPGVQGFLDGEPPLPDTNYNFTDSRARQSPIEIASPSYDSGWSSSSSAYESNPTAMPEDVRLHAREDDRTTVANQRKKRQKSASMTTKLSVDPLATVHTSQQEVKKFKARDERDNQSKGFRGLEDLLCINGDMADSARPLNPHNQRAGHTYPKVDILVSAQEALVRERQKRRELIERNRHLEEDVERMKRLVHGTPETSDPEAI